MRLRTHIVTACVLTVLSAGVTLSQSGRCPAIIAEAISITNSVCSTTQRNEACFGNINLSATARPDARNFQFEQVGDVVSVADISNLTLTGLDEEAGTWGVALMRLQGNIPDTLPGQNVTFVLFGDVTVEPNSTVEAPAPLQAFYLRTGVGESPCAEAPPSGVILQTPAGVSEVTFNINGVDISMGSTILFRTDTDMEMVVSALEGSAIVSFDGVLYPVIAGTEVSLPMDNNQVTSAPSLPAAYIDEPLDTLPMALLERSVTPTPPLTSEQIDQLYTTFQQAVAPCGDEDGVFPDCDNLPYFDDTDGETLRWANTSDWSLPPYRVAYNDGFLTVRVVGNELLLVGSDGFVCVLRRLRPTNSGFVTCESVMERSTFLDIFNEVAGQSDFASFYQRRIVVPPPPPPPPPSQPQSSQVSPPPPSSSGNSRGNSSGNRGNRNNNDDDDDDDD